MMAMSSDRRRFARVPMSGRMRWRSGPHTGECEVVDLSPGGAAFLVPRDDVPLFDDRVTLEMQVTPTAVWNVTERARVVRIMPWEHALCRVGVEFPATQSEDP